MPRKATSLDKKDKKILCLLNKNARISQTRIAKIVGMSRELVNYRINKLLKLKYILGFNLVVSNRALKFETYTILLELQNITNETQKEICEFLKRHESIKYLDRTNGDWDISVTVVVKTKIELARFIDVINEKYGNQIGENHLLSTVSVIKHETLNFIAKINYTFKRAERFYGKVVVLPKDRRILNTLSTNGALSIAQIARQTRLKPEACARRFKRLIEMGVITKSKAVVNLEKFNIQQYVLLLKISKFSRDKRKRISNFLRGEDYVMYAERILGNYDLKLVIVAEDQKGFDQHLTTLRAYLKEDIKSYSFSIILENLKKVSYPKGMW